MSTAKHTPGPWSLRRPIIEFIGRAKKPVWTTTTDAGTLTREGRGDLSRDQVLADAMLIAAAPELLEALVMVEGWIDPHDNQPHTQIIRAAIAKATGGAA